MRERLLSKDEACKILGIKPSTLDKLVRQKRFKGSNSIEGCFLTPEISKIS